MPHSSGGGSHGGGSHGGHSFSHSSSHFGSGGSSHRVYDHYVPGTNRYVYYKAGQPHYYYSDRKYKSEKSPVPFLIIFMAIWIAISIPFYIMIFHVPKKLVMDYNSEVIIEDGINVLTSGEETELYEDLITFRDKTGITPAIITVDNREWKGYYNDLENYAYDRYVNMFPDEKHWLIVYSSDLATGFEEWYFEGMQGDDTDGILTEKLTDEFNEIVNQCLTARTRYSVKEAFTEGFNYVSENGMKTSADPELLLFMILHSSIGLGIPLAMLILFLNQKKDPDEKLKENATLCPSATDALMEDTCEYCNGVYIHGIHTSCPHCGAAIKAKSRTIGYRLNE